MQQDPTENTQQILTQPERVLPDFTFEQVPAEIREAMESMGWKSLMPVQAKASPYLIDNRDMIVQSRTGSGKTGAFLIPLLMRIDPSRRYPQALVLVPTRELAVQVHKEFQTLSSRMEGIRGALLYGGVGYNTQLQDLREGAQVIIGTPGRVLDHIGRRSLNLDRLSILVFDEADEMLSMGFYPDMRELRRYVPRERSSWMFSATMPYKVQMLAHEFLRDPEFLSLSAGNVAVSTMEHRYYDVPPLEKDLMLMRLIEFEHPESAIIFCNTKVDVEYLATALKNYGYNVDQLSGDLDQKSREKAMGRIRRGEVRFLVATDVAARGIDISDLSHVFQYDVPKDPDSYIHRAGRTARAGNTGVVVTLVANMSEKSDLKKITRKYEIEFVELPIPTQEEVEERIAERVIVVLEDRFRTSTTRLGRERLKRFGTLIKSLAENDEERGLLAMLVNDVYNETFDRPAPVEEDLEPAPAPAPSQAPRQRTDAPPVPSGDMEQGEGASEGRKKKKKRKKKRRGGGAEGEPMPGSAGHPQPEFSEGDAAEGDASEEDAPEVDAPEVDTPEAESVQTERTDSDHRGAEGRRDDRRQDDRRQDDRRGDRPREERRREDRPQEDRRREDRPQEGRRQEERSQGDRPQGERRQEERSKGDRPQGDRPQGDRQRSERPQGEKQGGERQQGDRRQDDRREDRRREERQGKERRQGDRPEGERSDRRGQERQPDRRGEERRGDRRGDERRGDDRRGGERSKEQQRGTPGSRQLHVSKEDKKWFESIEVIEPEGFVEPEGSVKPAEPGRERQGRGDRDRDRGKKEGRREERAETPARAEEAPASTPEPAPTETSTEMEAETLASGKGRRSSRKAPAEATGAEAATPAASEAGASEAAAPEPAAKPKRGRKGEDADAEAPKAEAVKSPEEKPKRRTKAEPAAAEETPAKKAPARGAAAKEASAKEAPAKESAAKPARSTRRAAASEAPASEEEKPARSRKAAKPKEEEAAEPAPKKRAAAKKGGAEEGSTPKRAAKKRGE